MKNQIDITDNIFNFAPKELTNSAIWAWIFSALNNPSNDNPRLKIARNIFQILSIPCPDSNIRELHTEKTFAAIEKGNVRIKGSSKRLDVFLRTTGEKSFILFIENKVAEENIKDLYDQIKGYDDRFKMIQTELTDYAETIYPAYFGYEDWVAEQLIEKAKIEDTDFASRLRVFPASKMIKAFENTDYEYDPILSQFHNWLLVKKNFVEIRRQARHNNHAEIEKVISVSKSAGFGEILEEFIKGYNSSKFKNLIKRVQPDIRNINFYQKGASKKTPLTIRWFYDSGTNGLFIGIHEDVKIMTGIDLFKNLPTSFEYEKEQKWIFGFIKSKQEAMDFWK